MAGDTDNVVFFGKPTAISGRFDYDTTPLDVAAYDRLLVHAWRSEIDADASFEIAFEGSLDRSNWAEYESGDPGGVTETTFDIQLNFPWLRAVAKLDATGTAVPVVTLWATGWLVRRR